MYLQSVSDSDCLNASMNAIFFLQEFYLGTRNVRSVEQNQFMGCVGTVRAAVMSVSAPSATSETNTALIMRSSDTQHQTVRGQWILPNFVT